MNSRALRRLAADHGDLHNEPPPPNYFFAPNYDNEDLSKLEIYLAGPTSTPFEKGVWKLKLAIPQNYPLEPPAAFFITPLFHPNVDPQTGGVCVETLKRDWDSKLTLRDILTVIACLLIHPNPDSALNAEAGALLQEDYTDFAKRVILHTDIHAVPARDLRELAREAQRREPPAPRRRRPVQRYTAASSAAESAGRGRPGLQPAFPASAPFGVATAADDVFGDVLAPARVAQSQYDEDEEMVDMNQENDEGNSPQKTRMVPSMATPRRPNARDPLGELTVDDSSDSSPLEPEYPPSPSKSPHKRNQLSISDRPESSRDAAARGPNITPPNLFDRPLAQDSPYQSGPGEMTSPRRARATRPPRSAVRQPTVEAPQNASADHSTLPEGPSVFTQAQGSHALFNFTRNTNPYPTVAPGGSLFGHSRHLSSDKIKEPEGPAHQYGMDGIKLKPVTEGEKLRETKRKQAERDADLWEMCGRDTKRWNAGDFDGDAIPKKVSRW